MTATDLEAARATPKAGAEPFRRSGEELEFNLLDFWRWSSSDLVGNRLRGLLAEFLVAQAVGCTAGCRIEWDACDLTTPDGLRIEVKSAAYIQSWKQDRFSRIAYNIRPAQGWTAETNEWSREVKRRADVYVFCLLAHKDRRTLDPLDVSQWEFYCLQTSTLDAVGHQKTLSHSRLLQLCPIRTDYDGLREAILRLRRHHATAP